MYQEVQILCRTQIALEVEKKDLLKLVLKNNMLKLLKYLTIQLFNVLLTRVGPDIQITRYSALEIAISGYPVLIRIRQTKN